MSNRTNPEYLAALGIIECPQCHYWAHRDNTDCPQCHATGHPWASAALLGAKPGSDKGDAYEGPESDLQRDGDQWLTDHGVAISLHFSIYAREKKGWPDSTFAIRGRACAVEYKVGKRKPTEEQLKCHARLRRDGWQVAVCRSVDELRQFVAQVEAAIQ